MFSIIKEFSGKFELIKPVIPPPKLFNTNHGYNIFVLNNKDRKINNSVK
jgi:hypothetical protein